MMPNYNLPRPNVQSLSKPNFANRTPSAQVQFDQPQFATNNLPRVGFNSGAFGAGSQVHLNRPELSQLPGQQNRLEYDQKAVDAAQGAAFGRAKDEAAATTQAALNGLRGSLAARGMGGAGYAAGQVGQRVVQGANQIGEASRAQAEQASQLAQRGAELNYTGGITQRGQDIGAGSARDQVLAQLALGEYQGGITQRGQDQTGSLAEYQGGIQQRGQDLSSQQANNALLGQMALGKYQGGISQRGQDLDAQQALDALMNQRDLTEYQGGINQRGQDIQEHGQDQSNQQYYYGANQQNNQFQQQHALEQLKAFPTGPASTGYDSYGNPFNQYTNNIGALMNRRGRY